jgi:UDP:flavonoid glycosyltransferase YjiC (YdhE family)
MDNRRFISFERDQHEVARRVVEAGTGVRLPAKRLTADRLRRAVLQAMAMTVPPARTTRNADSFADAVDEMSALCSH